MLFTTKQNEAYDTFARSFNLRSLIAIAGFQIRSEQNNVTWAQTSKTDQGRFQLSRSVFLFFISHRNSSTKNYHPLRHVAISNTIFSLRTTNNVLQQINVNSALSVKNETFSVNVCGYCHWSMSAFKLCFQSSD